MIRPLRRSTAVALRVAGAALMAVPLLVGGRALAAPTTPDVAVPEPARAAAQTTSLGGYELLGRATAIRTLYDAPGSLPIGPLVEVTAPEAQASLATGPFGNALASTLYPGPLVEGAPSLLAGQGAPTQDVPPYPVVVRAASSGPAEASDEPAPGVRMATRVDGTEVEALSTTTAAQDDAVLDAGGSRSHATSVADGPTARSTAEAEVSDVVALGGLLRIDSVRSELEATSDSTSGRSKGRTVVSGASFAGIAVSIDEDGLTIAEDGAGGGAGEGEGGPLGPVGGQLGDGLAPATDALDDLLAQGKDALNDALAEAGFTIRVSEPRETTEGAGVTRTTEGLVIAYDREVGDTPLQDALSQIPLPPVPGSPVSSPGDVVAIMTNRQISEISIGRAEVRAGASPAFEAPTFTPIIDPPPSASPAAPIVVGQTPSRSGPVSVGTSDPSGTDRVDQIATLPGPSPIGSLGATTLVGLVMLAGLGGVLFTAGSRKLPDWALDGAVVAASGCTATDVPAAASRPEDGAR